MPIEKYFSEIRVLNSILHGLMASENAPRKTEINNLRQIAWFLLHDMKERPEEEAEAEIRELRERVTKLVEDPKSAGRSGEIEAMADTERSPVKFPQEPEAPEEHQGPEYRLGH